MGGETCTDVVAGKGKLRRRVARRVGIGRRSLDLELAHRMDGCSVCSLCCSRSALAMISGNKCFLIVLYSNQ